MRGLARRPGFTAASIATLALDRRIDRHLSVAYGVSMRPLPYGSSERLIRIYEANPANGQLEQDVSIGTFHAWREGAQSLESAALFGKSNVRFLSGRDSGQSASSASHATSSTFSACGRWSARDSSRSRPARRTPARNRGACRAGRVTSLDPLSLGGAVAVLLLVATVASLGPAALAARTDPAQSLRPE